MDYDDLNNPKFQPEKLIKSYGNRTKNAAKAALIHEEFISVPLGAKPPVEIEELTTKNAVTYLLAGNLNAKVCRYCLNETVELFELERLMEIANKNGIYSVSVKDMIASFHPFKVYNDPNLPNKICDKCLDRTISSYLFAQQCEQAERAIANCFEDIETKLLKLDPLEGRKRGRQKLNPNFNIIKAEHNKVIDYAEPTIQIVNSCCEPLSTEPEINPLECLKCCQVLPDALTLANHSQTHPKSMWFCCRLCGHSFPKLYLLKRHRRSHLYIKAQDIPNKVEKEEKFECKTCGELNVKYYNHIQHIEKHRFKSIMDHLLHGKMDRLCSVCLDKPEGTLVPLSKMISIHGGPPDLMGDRTTQSILASTLPEMSQQSNYSGTKICESCLNSAINSYIFKAHTYFVRDRFNTCVSLMLDNLKDIDPTSNICVEIAQNTIMPVKYPIYDYIFEFEDENDEIDILEDEFRAKEDIHEEELKVKKVHSKIEKNLEIKPQLNGKPNVYKNKTKALKNIYNSYENQICSEFLTFKKKSNLATIDKKVTCPTCSKHFLSDYFLKRHYLKHINSKVKCNACGMEFANKFSFNEHTKYTHILNQVYEACKICGRGFSKREKLKYHERRHKNKRCMLCNKIFKNQVYYDTHLQRHSQKLALRNNKNQETCSFCEKQFPNENQLFIHINKTHLQLKPYSCDMCEKQFYTDYNLRYHKKIHSIYKKETCKFCSKVLKSRKLLVTHIRKHIGATPHICQICNQSFYSQIKLKRHMKAVHGGRFICKICKHVSVSKNELKIHVDKAHSFITFM